MYVVQAIKTDASRRLPSYFWLRTGQNKDSGRVRNADSQRSEGNLFHDGSPGLGIQKHGRRGFVLIACACCQRCRSLCLNPDRLPSPQNMRLLDSGHALLWAGLAGGALIVYVSSLPLENIHMYVVSYTYIYIYIYIVDTYQTRQQSS